MRAAGTDVPRKRVLFFRDYSSFTGGHMKVFDYFGHVESSARHSAEIFLTPSSREDHLWRNRPGIVSSFEPECADILFVAGMDWDALNPFPGIETRKPVVNLIQHVRHAVREDPRFPFLSRRATRICVSMEIAERIKATGQCNGPVHVIDNGIDFSAVPDIADRTCDVFIAGLKMPQVARELSVLLGRRGIKVDCQVSQEKRSEFLARMGRASIAVTLPDPTEGFFLPALEAMALGCAVICPDCVGNRSFCIDGETCLMPSAEPAALQKAVLSLIDDPEYARSLAMRGRAMSRRYDLAHERAEFLRILDGL